ncbi:hypothetical protein AAVH_02495 [Aphelenchoides avenae]|nr:hypothetical protein AAVH_02495 [Aphelenchus avenae]
MERRQKVVGALPLFGAHHTIIECAEVTVSRAGFCMFIVFVTAQLTRRDKRRFQLLEIFCAYGTVEEVIIYRLQFALVIFRWVRDAMEAKRELDLYQTKTDGSYIHVLLREVQFFNGQPSASERPFDKLRVDYALPSVAHAIKSNPKVARKMLTNPWEWSAWGDQHDRPMCDVFQQGPTTAVDSREDDDFYDDGVFDDPSLKAVLTGAKIHKEATTPVESLEADDFYDDAVFEDPCMKAALNGAELTTAQEDDFADDTMFDDQEVIASLSPM